MNANAQGDFWTWSLEAYARPGAAPAALRLQDEFGLDVNICLWCAWSAAHFSALSDIHLRKALELTQDCRRELIEPLRRARRYLKTAADAEAGLCEQAKAMELAGERLEQSRLEALAREHLLPVELVGDRAAAARRNLARYAALAGAAKKQGFSVSLLESFLDPILQPAATGRKDAAADE